MRNKGKIMVHYKDTDKYEYDFMTDCVDYTMDKDLRALIIKSEYYDDDGYRIITTKIINWDCIVSIVFTPTPEEL